MKQTVLGFMVRHNKSLKQTPRAGQKTNEGALRRCLAPGRYAAYLFQT